MTAKELEQIILEQNTEIRKNLEERVDTALQKYVNTYVISSSSTYESASFHCPVDVGDLTTRDLEIFTAIVKERGFELSGHARFISTLYLVLPSSKED